TPTIEDNKTEEGEVTSVGEFSSSMTGLNSNTLYYVRTYATNTAGTVYGIEVTFSTLPDVPVAITEVASGIGFYTAMLNGTITANDASTIVTFEYGTDENYGTTVNADQSPVTGNSSEGVTCELTGLVPNTIYYYRVVAVNDGGTTYGSELTFKTLSQTPVVTTNAATNIEANTATLNGIVNANDLSTTVTFEYGTDENYGTTVNADQSPVTGILDTDVSADLTGMYPNTTYHFRIVGENDEGIMQGDDQTFTTTKYNQGIIFNELPDKETDDQDFDPGATSSFGLEIIYLSNNSDVASIVNNQIHIVGAGTSEIIATQQGNDTVNAATPVSQMLTVTKATFIEDIDALNFKIYPNPVRDILNVEVLNNKIENINQVSIINLSGKEVYNDKNVNTKKEINVKYLASGIYYIELKIGNKTKRQKFIIE
ncbi:MAG: T9SS type A sorting domain-containing protein, partial [Bacteroidetes bacterium]|nr:T9SS type A sorting domain-containing protein [Bacteroidota bacterium]